MEEQVVIKKKICMIGAPAVGKTSLVRRFVFDLFDDKYLTTIGVKISQKELPPVVSIAGLTVQYTLLVWDIEGTEKMRAAIKNYYKGASGALLVADLSRLDTLQVIPPLMAGFQAESPGAKIILVGNKLDLVQADAAGITDLAKLADTNGLRSYHTSAKSGKNVEKAFFKFAELFAMEKK